MTDSISKGQNFINWLCQKSRYNHAKIVVYDFWKGLDFNEQQSEIQEESREAKLIKQCDESDRLGEIVECPWVRLVSYKCLIWLSLHLKLFQMTSVCMQRWRAKCFHVRNGGLLTSPPPTTMILSESNTTSIVYTTSATPAIITEPRPFIDFSSQSMNHPSENYSGFQSPHIQIQYIIYCIFKNYA